MVEQGATQRSRWPTYALAAVFATWLAITVMRSHTLPAIRCGLAPPPDADTVVMLSASWCGYCRAARRFLQGEKIKYCEYDIETDDEGRRRFASQAVKVIPILTLGEQTFVGFEREEILVALQARGLRELRE